MQLLQNSLPEIFAKNKPKYKSLLSKSKSVLSAYISVKDSFQNPYGKVELYNSINLSLYISGYLIISIASARYD